MEIRGRRGRERKWMPVLAPHGHSGAQSWCLRTVRDPFLGAQYRCLRTVLVPQGDPGASPGEPSPGAPGLDALEGRKRRKVRKEEREGRGGNEGEREGRKETGCQSWRPRAILLPSPGAQGRPASSPGHPVPVPQGCPGASPGKPSPGAPGLESLGREGEGMKGRD